MPSFVWLCGHLITPALFIKTSSCLCSVTNQTSYANNLYNEMYTLQTLCRAIWCLNRALDYNVFLLYSPVTLCLNYDSMNTQYIIELTAVKIFLSRCTKHHNTIIYGGLEGQPHTFLALVPHVHALATLSFREISLAPTG